MHEISAANAISGPFLFKILQPLVENGLIESVRGRNGGIRLARPSNKITLTEVILATEANLGVHDCIAEGITDCPLIGQCSYHAALKRAFDAFTLVLSRHTIADLVADRARISQVFGVSNLDHGS